MIKLMKRKHMYISVNIQSFTNLMSVSAQPSSTFVEVADNGNSGSSQEPHVVKYVVIIDFKVHLWQLITDYYFSQLKE